MARPKVVRFKLPKTSCVPQLIEIANEFGGYARYSSSSGGAYIVIQDGDRRIEVRRGDYIARDRRGKITYKRREFPRTYAEGYTPHK